MSLAKEKNELFPAWSPISGLKGEFYHADYLFYL